MKRTVSQWLRGRPETWVIVAHVLTLTALSLSLLFFFRTTGGTVFLFTTLAPALSLMSIAIVVWLAIEAYRRRHHMLRREVFQAGQVVFRQGDAAHCAYFIESGGVEVSRLHNGQPQVLAQLGVGDCFGELSLLSDDPKRGATVRALEETHVAVVGKANFLRMLYAIPSVRDEVLNVAHKRALSNSGS